MARNQRRRPVKKNDLPEIPAVTSGAPPLPVEPTPGEKAAEDAVRRMVEAAYT